MPTALSQWYPTIIPHVPTAPEPLIDQALRWAADEFCARSGIVQEFLQADAVAGTATVTFAPPTGTVAHRPRAVWYRDSVLYSAGPTLVDTPKAFVATPTGTPLRFLDMRGNTMRVYPAPETTETNAFAALLVLVPTFDATELPDVLFREWREAIAAGARVYIKSIPGQPFSGNAEGDAVYFGQKLKEAAAVALTGSVRGELVARSPMTVGFFGRR